MKKTKLTRSLLAACSIVALTAVMYGCVHDGGSDPEPMVEPMPEPEPDPGPPADLTDTQQDAADAAAAAMTASTNAAAAAKAAADATMNIATLQTNGMAADHATAAGKAAADAKTASDAAAAASATAAAATTGAAAEAAARAALAAQADAEAAAMTADTESKAAIAAAMTELHISGSVKSVGESSINAKMGKLTTPAAVTTDPDIVTGLQNDLMREMSGEVKGQQHSAPGVTPVVPYKQAVAARNLAIGQTLDTTDDKARLTVIHSRAGSKMTRVYATDGVNTSNIVITTTNAGVESAAEGGTDLAWWDDGLRSLGTYIEATQTTPAADDPLTLVDETAGDVPTALDHSDVVGADTKLKEVYAYLHFGADGVRGGNDDTTRYVVKTITNTTVGGDTVETYQHVDVTAPAAPDSPDSDGLLQQVQVKAAIPMAIEYDHIHFGVWASLGDPDKTSGVQKITDLGIGFVQNIKGGVTEKQGIGTATYNGDWVAVIQRQNSAAKGAYNMYDGAAKLTANFDKAEFTAALTGLATLSGTLANNGFSGSKATQIAHDDLDKTATFTGEFSGGIYGPTGTEAAGVFDFAGGEAGSFRGAFGGTNQP